MSSHETRNYENESCFGVARLFFPLHHAFGFYLDFFGFYFLDFTLVLSDVILLQTGKFYRDQGNKSSKTVSSLGAEGG
jgi:hypothetical protein